ncbi:hypothetical protein [Paucibacter sp. Y2R2-4]|uniref:hypothetical protein n=1 Tax=Paucibacter sp. Y2R2-4 TaxID=2893553 RepID=UPI0021E510CB|nr:hypothetical protein [Paucibacter sp. Y2R2-4]MCV2350659.1 hypothetical protein [Paucibacter sp. Y2R2-4]
MLSKAILFIGGTIAMSLTWLFATMWLIDACCDLAIQGGMLASVFCVWLVAAAVVSWKLFVKQGTDRKNAL